MADKTEFLLSSKDVPRRDREAFFSVDVPRRREDLSWAVNDILHSLAISMPELTYVQAQAERQEQSTLSAMDTPAADPRLTAATERSLDNDLAAQQHAEAMRSVTGISDTEERAMEANAVAPVYQPAEVAPQAATQSSNPGLEAEARFLIDQVFGPQEDQHELA